MAPVAASADWVGAAVVRDDQLSALARVQPAGASRGVSVVNTGGAGGLLGLARRTPEPLRVVAVESALRDLDDLAGNAARIAAAARDLPDDPAVFVEIPNAWGWERAVAAVEAEGLAAKIDAAAGLASVGDLLAACVEADLPFKVSGLDVDGLLPLLVMVAALVDDADPAEAIRAGQQPEPELARTVREWDVPAQTRVRRRLLACDSPDITATAVLLHSGSVCLSCQTLRARRRASVMQPLKVAGGLSRTRRCRPRRRPRSWHPAGPRSPRSDRTGGRRRRTPRSGSRARRGTGHR